MIDNDFNAKVSDFGLAKLLESGESFITTRVMGTFGYKYVFLSFHIFDYRSSTLGNLLTSILNFRYVAPEYANTGLLNEKSDVYSFGVLLLEVVTGRDPVDYARPANEVPIAC